MESKYKYILFLFLTCLLSIYITSCVNVVQKVKINEDGSGTIFIRYWAKSLNIVHGELGGFGFTEEKVRLNFTSSNSEPYEIRIDNNITQDFLTMVTLKIHFNDINELSKAAAFKNVETSFIGDSGKKYFKYIILKEQVSEIENETLLHHEFEFPGDIILTNGFSTNKQNTIIWKNTVADLIDNIEMIAVIKCE